MTQNIFSAASAKLSLFPDRINDWCDGRPVVPITVEIHPSEQCNHNCPDCQARYALARSEIEHRRRNGKFLDMQCLGSLWESPPEGIVVSGNTGDPLMNPQTIQLLKTTQEKQIPTVMITNLQNLEHSMLDVLVESCQGVRVSLDAANADDFKRRHGSMADWQIVIDNIRNLVQHRNKLQANNCLIGVGYLTDNVSQSGMLRATEVARDLGVDYIQFRPYHYRAGEVAEQLVACQRLTTEAFSVLSSDQKYSRLSLQERSYNVCHGGNFYAVIDSRADVYVCCHQVGNSKARYGSLLTQSWREIIESYQRREAIRSFPCDSCVPLCRLHAHNEALEGYRPSSVPTLGIADLVRRHAAFL